MTILRHQYQENMLFTSNLLCLREQFSPGDIDRKVQAVIRAYWLYSRQDRPFQMVAFAFNVEKSVTKHYEFSGYWID